MKRETWAACAVAVAAACRAPPRAGTASPDTPGSPPAARELVAVPGATFVMGDPQGEPDEAPRTVRVEPFRIMRHEVTTARFRDYVAETGAVTDPERRGFGMVWRHGDWVRSRGADWRHPFGTSSSPRGARHPVVQVSQRDAAAFCRHHGMRLPTEKEWELAARGTTTRRFPWGDDPPRHQVPRANFGTVKCCAPSAADGYRKTAPVGSFPRGASPFGIHDLAGNVWEWTASPFPGRPGMVALRGGGWGNDPYCLRVSYRHGNPPDLGRDMIGFRCAMDAPAPRGALSPSVLGARDAGGRGAAPP